ncbi:MAG TPA: CehA/McbA family metallohydrolase [Vicinamibacteria bacterium]|nr:CehA/McbA family metallohydrolase [Vicinamibacteria bacterium]
MSRRRGAAALALGLALAAGGVVESQAPAHHPEPTVPLQPLAQHVRRLQSALSYLGQPLPPADRERIDRAMAQEDERRAVAALEETLDAHVLVRVEINPESRVKVEQGDARPELVEGGTRLFLVKVVNQAGVTAPLTVTSPNHGRVSVPSTGHPEPKMELGPREAAERWADISLYDRHPMGKRLSGLGLEYWILEVMSRDRGRRSAQLGFHVGQGTQDIGFRNDVLIVFDARPARAITLRVRDEHGAPAVASFVVRDAQDRLYSAPSKRLAPDLPFQPQLYRADGETIRLPPGSYTVAYSAGPEYRPGRRELTVDESGPAEAAFALERWIDPAGRGWYSGDHHIHAAGCSHYENPTQGVGPDDIMRQILGESLNVGSVLTWGPCYYHQKQFFSGGDHPLSRPNRILRYDLEVSGFPSSHAGHLVLLGLREQDYPGTRRLEDWPSWGLPILRWAKAQGAVTGFAHSGWGLEVKSRDLPTDEMPGFDGIGANEYIVDVTHQGAVDFISAVDTPHVWELNIWYHTLNVGFRTRISGETDWPCIYDDRVGLGRTYAKVDGGLTFAGWLESMRTGRSYVSDGKTHLMEFTVGGRKVGEDGSELRLAGPATVKVEVQAAALLDETPDTRLRDLPDDQQPYWDVERARVGPGREVAVELVVNGEVAGRQTVVADGAIRPLAFDVPIGKSSWVAARIRPAAHTNPVFVLVGDKPVRASRRSARWCLAAVDQCWSQKAPRIREAERGAAREAYDHARAVYRRRLAESPDE